MVMDLDLYRARASDRGTRRRAGEPGEWTVTALHREILRRAAQAGNRAERLGTAEGYDEALATLAELGGECPELAALHELRVALVRKRNRCAGAPGKRRAAA